MVTERDQCLKNGSTPTSEGSQIHLKLVVIWLTPTIHFYQQNTSSLLKLTFILSSSSCFLHVLFSLNFFLKLSTSKLNALLNTWPYQRTVFSIAKSTIVSIKLKINIKFLALFQSLSCTPHIALTTDLSAHYKNPITFFQAPCFISIQHWWSYIAVGNSHF